MIGNGQRHTLGQLQLAPFNKSVDVFRQVNYLKVETCFTIEPVEGVVTLSAWRDHRLDSGLDPCPGVPSGSGVQLPAISPLVSSATAARFVLAHDANIHTCVPEQGDGGPGSLPQPLIVAVKAAGMKNHPGLFLGQILYIQSISPSAPICLGPHHHILFIMKAIDIGLVLGQRLAILH